MISDPGNLTPKLEKKPSQGPIVVEGLLPNSPYISSLPEYQPLVSEYKMLKYWEKHIIPKIQDFVRSSYKPWEFEEFFEQLRQPLRKGDHNKAAEIAYILCDQRLPNGCVLPDANHDWSTISIEEIVLGTWAIASIHNKSNKLISPFFQPQSRIGNKDVLVQLLATDQKTSSVLALYHDFENLQTVTVWLPVINIKPLELPLGTPPVFDSEAQIMENFEVSTSRSIAFLARDTILKFFNFNRNEVERLKKETQIMGGNNFSFVNLLKWSILDDLAEDPVEGWLTASEWEVDRKNQRNSKNLNPNELINEAKKEKKLHKARNNYSKLDSLKDLLTYMAKTNAKAEIEKVQSWLSENLAKVVEYINNNASSFDM
mmetsp:Transcript_5971/g.5268  ORF Transcript_5971/g.5268 Transcript_5971/m.5268 type:complete len:372 (+) Transcript_5971:3382-4497(+)